ncbi:sodium-coupled monocarboxylate transporter 2-like [Periplaneta americana]|uniref:sodium-coupled monocarboxylate transporter 2-like n=1 Tax=Periplaneta americana TaxID=6978 RepID=UPI0037E919B0
MDTNSTLEELGMQKLLFFGWLDFTLFILMLGFSTLIGIYFGIWGRKEDTPKEYLHGGKTMNTTPVAISLVASFLSGIMMMGAPTEIYLYGTLYWLVSVCVVIVGVLTDIFYLPVFYELQLTSTYEYLQLRFSRRVRVMASVVWTIGLLLYIPIVLYVPALAFSQVSGVNVHITALIIAALCIFYTMMGGIKAVVWTDVLQGVVMTVASIVVIILGVIEVGGVGVVWERSQLGGRIRIFEMDISPFKRMTFWSVVIGNCFTWLGGFSLSQAAVQKFMALPTYSKARMSLYIFVLEVIFISSISCVTGLLIYAKYYDCDPITSKIISRPDQLLPYYVMDIASSVPGLPGLFVAGIFSASLSTMSSSLNSLGATLFEDFVRPCFKEKISDHRANIMIKCVVVVIGGICLAFVFVVDKLGAVLQMCLRAQGVTYGAMIGMFSLGMFYPRGNSKGALAGSICSLLVTGWIVFGSQVETSYGRIKNEVLPASVEGCGFNVTLSEHPPTEAPEDDVFILYQLSIMYYAMTGTVIAFVVGIIVSHFTEEPSPEQVKPVFFTPLVRKYIVERRTQNTAYNNHIPETELLTKTQEQIS